MLVVIAIIGILASMLIPAGIKAVKTARRIKCASNLANIYRAYRAWHSDILTLFNPSPLPSLGWAGLLSGYFNKDDASFVCPEDRNPRRYGGICASLYLQGFRSGALPLESGGACPIEPGTYHRRLNGATITTLKASSTYGRINEPWTISWDKWTITVNPTGGYISVDGTELAWPDGYLNYKYQAPPYLEHINGTKINPIPYGERPRSSYIFYKSDSSGTYDLRNIPIKTTIIKRCSYGMNDLDLKGKAVTGGGTIYWNITYEYLRKDLPRETVLFMDYTNVVIRASLGLPWGDASSFARHNGKCNVLFVDGSIKCIDPVELNPADTNNYVKYWRPIIE